jgi:hypothetical protein
LAPKIGGRIDAGRRQRPGRRSVRASFIPPGMLKTGGFALAPKQCECPTRILRTWTARQEMDRPRLA